jgi:hypothetical protein
MSHLLSSFPETHSQAGQLSGNKSAQTEAAGDYGFLKSHSHGKITLDKEIYPLYHEVSVQQFLMANRRSKCVILMPQKYT